MVGRAAFVATGLATIVATLGFWVTSGAWATLPHIKNGSEWTFEVNQHGCEVETFSPNGTFTANAAGDEGKWSGGGTTLKMKWKGGLNSGLTFTGTFNGTVGPKEYAGALGRTVFGETGQLVKGALSNWNGTPCG
jgi:hypothetical protein